jgi:hypothetical protein
MNNYQELRSQSLDLAAEVREFSPILEQYLKDIKDNKAPDSVSTMTKWQKTKRAKKVVDSLAEELVNVAVTTRTRNRESAVAAFRILIEWHPPRLDPAEDWYNYVLDVLPTDEDKVRWRQHHQRYTQYLHDLRQALVDRRL